MMDKIDKLIEEVGDRFLHVVDDSRFIYSVHGNYTVGVNMSAIADKICTVGEYKERLNQKRKPKMHISDSDEVTFIKNSEQQLLETYTGLAVQALITTGETPDGVKALAVDYAKAAIESMSDNNG